MFALVEELWIVFWSFYNYFDCSFRILPFCVTSLVKAWGPVSWSLFLRWRDSKFLVRYRLRERWRNVRKHKSGQIFGTHVCHKGTEDWSTHYNWITIRIGLSNGHRRFGIKIDIPLLQCFGSHFTFCLSQFWSVMWITREVVLLS